MRSSAFAAVAVVIVGNATEPGDVRADPAVTLDWEQTVSALELDPAHRLDPAPRTELEGIGAQTFDVVNTRYALGPHARAAIHTTLRWNDNDVPAEGWTVDARVARDLGWNVSLVLEASLGRAIGGLDRGDGMYASFGIALVRLFRLTHGRVAWISLGVGESSWFGGVPSRVPGGTVAGLHVGSTF